MLHLLFLGCPRLPTCPSRGIAEMCLEILLELNLHSPSKQLVQPKSRKAVGKNIACLWVYATEHFLTYHVGLVFFP